MNAPDDVEPVPASEVPASAGSASSRRRWPLFLLVLVVLLAGTAAGLLWVRTVRNDGPDHPKVWNARVREYVEAVEDERGLKFKHPVYVDFLSVSDFKDQVTDDEEDLSDEDRREIRQFTGLFRALGLVEGDLDLFKTMNQLAGAGIVGYYSDVDERIRLRGSKLTPTVQSTLVHELTHALQDQYFDIGKRQAQLDKDEASAASSGYKMVIEGDASRVESAWRQTLDKGTRKLLEKSEATQGEAYNKDVADVPDVLETLMASPYVLGEALLDIALKDGGDKAVNRLFRSPPTTEEHQLDPWTLIEDHQAAREVPDPNLADGDKEFDSGPFGATSWLLVLAERIPPKQALRAADGWGGDAYVAYERDGRTCVKIRYRGDTRADLEQMHTALTAWVGRLPDGPTSVRRVENGLLFDSCDPGTKTAAAATGDSRQALSLAVSRTYLSATMLDSGLPTTAARCAADRLVREFTIAELNSDDADQKRVQRALAPCAP